MIFPTCINGGIAKNSSAITFTTDVVYTWKWLRVCKEVKRLYFEINRVKTGNLIDKTCYINTKYFCQSC
jgi:hypothetical protein